MLAISGSYLFLLLFNPNKEVDVCIFKHATGIPCPGCGGTRAMELLFAGHVKESVLINPTAIAIFVFSLIAITWIIFDILKSTHTFQVALRKKWNKWYLYSAIILIITNWIWNISKGL